MAWDIDQLRADLAELPRGAAIGYLRRRPGNVEALIDRLTRTPSGEPSNYPAAVDALAAYGAYLLAAAEAIRDKPEDPPVMVPLRTPRGF